MPKLVGRRVLCEVGQLARLVDVTLNAVSFHHLFRALEETPKLPLPSVASAALFTGASVEEVSAMLRGSGEYVKSLRHVNGNRYVNKVHCFFAARLLRSTPDRVGKSAVLEVLELIYRKLGNIGDPESGIPQSQN